MISSRSILSAAAALLVASSPLFALQFPLSENAARSAYFLGQRRDQVMGEFLARYSKHLPAPTTGPYVSDVLFLTPYAQLVQYSSRQGMYSAQQAEIDGRTKLSTVEVTVYINFTDTYGELIPDPAPSRSSGTGVHLRHAGFWRDFQFRAFDGNDLREPAAIQSDAQYRCSGEGGCAFIGSQVHLSFPAESFTTDFATIEIATPDGQLITAEFDLASLR